jgi:hypothetical protein
MKKLKASETMLSITAYASKEMISKFIAALIGMMCFEYLPIRNALIIIEHTLNDFRLIISRNLPLKII